VTARLEVDADEYASLVAANLRYRDKLLSIAKECLGCDGAGCVTMIDADHSVPARVEPCSECADLREVLA
jgi:hypothetical protein